MSVLYRAIWNDDRDGLVPAALDAFRAWVALKSDGGLLVLDDGRVEGPAWCGPADRTVRGR